MAQFATVWAIKTPIEKAAGQSIEVALKRGGTKVVELGAFLYELNGSYYYASPPKANKQSDE